MSDLVLNSDQLHELAEMIADGLAQRHELAELVADELAQRLLGGEAPDARIDAAEVARRFGVTRTWAYEHAAELGAIRLGTGQRGRLRFDPVHVERVLAERGTTSAPSLPPSPAPQRRRRRDRSPRTAAGAPLLEVKPS